MSKSGHYLWHGVVVENRECITRVLALVTGRRILRSKGGRKNWPPITLGGPFPIKTDSSLTWPCSLFSCWLIVFILFDCKIVFWFMGSLKYGSSFTWVVLSNTSNTSQCADSLKLPFMRIIIFLFTLNPLVWQETAILIQISLRATLQKGMYHSDLKLNLHFNDTEYYAIWTLVYLSIPWNRSIPPSSTSLLPPKWDIGVQNKVRSWSVW